MRGGQARMGQIISDCDNGSGRALQAKMRGLDFGHKCGGSH